MKLATRMCLMYTHTLARAEKLMWAYFINIYLLPTST